MYRILCGCVKGDNPKAYISLLHAFASGLDEANDYYSLFLFCVLFCLYHNYFHLLKIDGERLEMFALVISCTVLSRSNQILKQLRDSEQ